MIAVKLTKEEKDAVRAWERYMKTVTERRKREAENLPPKSRKRRRFSLPERIKIFI